MMLAQSILLSLVIHGNRKLLRAASGIARIAAGCSARRDQGKDGRGGGRDHWPV